jgi:hypothetical protein
MPTPEGPKLDVTKVVVLAEERGLQPAKNPPQMPQVKPPKSEK